MIQFVSLKGWESGSGVPERISKTRRRRTNLGHARWDRKTRQRTSARYRNPIVVLFKRISDGCMIASSEW